jgi:general stress protein 26
MIKIDEDVLVFLEKQNIVMTATIDSKGKINIAAKAIAKIDPTGIIYVVDLYNGTTKANLKNNPNITISAVDEQAFKGWQLKGIAKEYNEKETKEILENWDKKILKRMTDRIISNLKKNTKINFSEIHLPKPEYIIEIKVEEIVDLSGK